MDRIKLGEGAMIAFAGMGVQFEDWKENDNQVTQYISVPETSDHIDSNGNELAGAILAKTVKRGMTKVGIMNLTVKYRIRQGDHWTDQKRNEAEVSMKKLIHAS